MKTTTALATVLLILGGVGCSTEPSGPSPPAGGGEVSPGDPAASGGEPAVPDETPAEPAGDAEPSPETSTDPADPTDPANPAAPTEAEETMSSPPGGPAIPDGTPTPEAAPDEAAPDEAESSPPSTDPAGADPGETPVDSSVSGGMRDPRRTVQPGPKKVESPAAAIVEFNRVLFGRIQKRLAEKKKAGGAAVKGRHVPSAKPEPGTE